MPINIEHLISFSEFPNVTAGFFVPKKNLLVTGHENGLVLNWNVARKEYKVLFKCGTKIETVSYSGGKEIAVGTSAGDLVVLDLEKPEKPDVIQEATHDVHSRVWRTLWAREDSLIATSTYGVMNQYRKKAGVWEKIPLPGHSNSVFGLNSLGGKLLASGDYLGYILIWDFQDGQFRQIADHLKVNRAVEDIAWQGDATFATVDRNGMIHLFEKTGEGKQWQSVYEVDSASSFGRCIHITEDGKTVFAGTDNEVVQFDIDSQQAASIDQIKGARRIFSSGDAVFVLTLGGFEVFHRKEVEVQAGFIKYRYAKVSLIGHTGVGKSTLCNLITTGSPGNVKSTFGKRVWNWNVSGTDALKRRIIFHDHGGQKTVLGTFLPFLVDEDIILILFQKKDKTTLTTALETLEQIKKSLNPKTKVFFVQTFIDHDVRDFDEGIIKRLLDEKQITGHLEICPPLGKGVEELKDRLKNEISWENARIMIQSQYASGAIDAVSSLQGENVNVIQFEDFKQYYEKKLGLQVSARHLKFLLRDLTNQGIIDFYPEASSLIILNDEKYNKLRTNVPIFVEEKRGIVSFNDLVAEFDNPEYLSILDSVYQSYKISIRNRELRIFPEKLTTDPITIPEPYNTFLKGLEPEEKSFRSQRIAISRLVEALSGLNLNCIDASQTDGLFSWDENANIYYTFQTVGNAIRGYKVKCTYFIGGKRKETCERLKNEFESIIESLFGPFVVDAENEVKKKALGKKAKFDVALSFAGEQRDYVEKVYSILSGKGVDCFYDEIYRAHLWGTNLAEFLHDVYYSQSRYCIMFISKEYITKAWPTHERRSAIAKYIELAGARDYILPVVFDDSEVPGLQISLIGYLDARKVTAEKVAELFLQKLKYRENT